MSIPCPLRRRARPVTREQLANWLGLLILLSLGFAAPMSFAQKPQLALYVIHTG